MSKYDNWERLVTVVLRRQHDREIALSHSRDNSSISSTSFSSNLSFNSTSRSDHASNLDLPVEHSDLTVDHSGWRAMLPPGEHKVVWRSASMSFFVDRRTGKNCFLLGATKVVSEDYWRMRTHPKSRFEAVATLDESWELEESWELDIRGRIKTKMLSPATLYAAYLVFEFTDGESMNPESSDRFYNSSSDDDDYSREPLARIPQPSKSKNSRADGWKEEKIGEFYVGKEDNRHVEVRLIEMSSYIKKGLIVEGIEFRPLVKKAKIFGTRASTRTANISYI